MLNGKFFTGLPPKMIERGTNGTRNRQESHFYWPDESQAETALESRQKRRNSLQTGAITNVTNNRPQLQQQFSIGENEVDTKQMFQKEFAKSSIQFYDNLQESNAPNENRARNKTQAHTMKREIACKPTAVKLELPISSDIEDDYAHVKKQQTFASKIQFYDFVEEQPPRNNMRKPRMDLNDKRELERNTKNSPKLQTKRSFANSRENVRDNSYNDVKPNERRVPTNNMRNVASAQISRELQDRANAFRGREREQMHEHEFEEYENESNDWAANNERYQRQQYSVERDLPPERHASYKHEMDKRAYRAKSEDPKHDVLPKRILKSAQQHSQDSLNEHDTDELDVAMSQLYTRRPTPRPVKKHVTYRDDYDDELADEMTSTEQRQRAARDFVDAAEADEDDDLSENFNVRPIGLRKSATAPNMKAGNTKRQPQKQKQNQMPHENQQQRNQTTQRQYMETGSVRPAVSALKKSLNNQHNLNYNNRVNSRQNTNNSNNNVYNSNERTYRSNSNNNNDDYNAQQEQIDTINRDWREQHADEHYYNGNGSNENNNNGSMTSSPTAAVATPKHLRSSLCFNDGAIVADSSKTTMTPTAQQTRRNARSSATQRVSVGLPD